MTRARPTCSITAANLERIGNLPPGWAMLWLRFCARLACIDPEPSVGWAGAKFAELRVQWWRDADADARALADELRAESARVCEVCGGPGLRGRGPDMVVATRCAEHPREASTEWPPPR